MPELPEVETVRRGLAANVAGRRVARVEVGRERTVRRTSAQALIDGLTGVAIAGWGRRGKYLLGQLDSGDVLMIHLRMSGRVLLAPPGAPRPPHTHVVLHLEAGGGPGGRPAEELWFVDPRTFGEVVVFDPGNVAAELPELSKLGIDPVTDGLSRAELTALLRGRDRRLKPLLLDQHVIAGIGNIYCDETLHLARLRPDRLASSLTTREIGRLHRAIHETLAQAIEAGGSTLNDTQYVDLEGQGGWFQLHHRVYDRAGQRCLTCRRATVVRTVSGGRSTCFCPRCQH
ncbi:MAG: bifunctional DNA-formamidopyrimidine glycosylase/DNA-(apurinic or apyrimidinic site) lyase [Ilumatobacteraceae bacterium]